MKKTLSLALALTLALSWLCACPARAEERPVLTIGDVQTRSSSRVDGAKQVRFWRYIEDQLGMDIQFVYMTPEVYAAGLSSGDLPDIVATDNNLATILDNGVAFNAGPYLEEYVPNFLQGKARTAYDVFTALMDEEDGFYFFPQKIGYNGVGYSNEPANRGYVVRWDYYKELGYPPINNEDDYLRVLQQMHANHPTTEEGYPTYLFGTNNFPAMLRPSVPRSASITGHLTSIRTTSSPMRCSTGIRTQSIPCGGPAWPGSTSFTGPARRTAPSIWNF